MSVLSGTEYPIVGYRITEQIYVSSKTLVYRAIRELDQQSVIIKLMRTEYPTFAEIGQFRNQYTITQNLDLPGIVKPLSFESYHNSYALVMEDFDGISLKDWQQSKQKEKNKPVSLDEFFHIAIEITAILDGLHRERIIHKDIKPANILINSTTGEVKLIDFSLATILPREIQSILNPNVLEGTLAYISPEQTGRMNRGIDYRSDFYSLGITFFELLTGLLPFTSNEPMELVYCHIAKEAPKVSHINFNIPLVLSNIINKLIAKNAEDRYQSSQGLKHDLEICRNQWQETGNIASFELGMRDISHHFVIPEKLYGRQNEVETLLTTFERVTSGKKEMLLVSGVSGIGKTAVINEVHKRIVRQRSYFIKGKFDQFQRDIPLSALVQAFRDLIGQILSETDAQIQDWKSKILAVLDTQGCILTEVIPELERIIGKQPPVAELSGSACQNRFNTLLQKFIHVFTNKEHPLVIFLDDLQWADVASLNFLQVLMSQSTSSNLTLETEKDSNIDGGLLLIGAYRDNEISTTHPLYLTLTKINEVNIYVNTINLLPLNQNDLNQLIADTLHCASEVVIALTQIVFAKTKGNPFFVNQFLKYLYENKLITLNSEVGYWQYKIQEIQELTFTDDVVEFMADQIKKLPNETQEALKVAACIGNEFDLKTLAIIYKKSILETASDLWMGLLEGLIISHGNYYNVLPELDDYGNIYIAEYPTNELSNKCHLTKYKFVHDRIQQAAYSLILQKYKKFLHLEIGILLNSNTPVYEREEKIFELVNQFNIAVELITNEKQRNELAAMNLTAGRKALASTAYSAAIKYLTTGIELLPSDCWDAQYKLTLNLHETAAEATYLSGNFEQMEQLLEIVLIQAKTLLDKVKAYEIKIEAYKAQGCSFDAIKTGVEILNLLDLPFPEQPNQADIEVELQQVQLAFVGKQIDNLFNLPHLTDPNKLVLMKIMGRLLPITYASNSLMFSLIALKQVNLSLIYGNCDVSSLAYAVYAVNCWSLSGNLYSCYRLGQLALKLLDIFNPRELRCITTFVVNNFTIHWQDHLQQSLNSLISAYSIGLETGDLEQAAYAIYMYAEHSFFLGKNLSELEREMSDYHEKIQKLNQEIPLQLHTINWQAVLNLLKVENSSYLQGKAYTEESMLPLMNKKGNKLAIFYIYLEQLLLCYLFENYLQAYENATYAEEYLETVPAKFVVTIFYFYSSLSALAIYTSKNKEQQQYILESVTHNQQKMQQWAENAPMNFLHKYYLVEAELYRVLGKNLDAMELYDRAIALAQQHNYIHEEALANELAAKFYLQWGKQRFAQTYLTDAYYGYLRWGALAKIQDLQTRYPQLLTTVIQQEKLKEQSQLKSEITHSDVAINSTLTASETVISSHSTSISDMLDLAAVIKASQVLSGEIELQELLSKLIELVMENAGASKCVLILKEDNNSALTVTAVSTSSTFEVTHTNLSSIQLESSQDVPINIINYVKRTEEILVIDDTEVQISFATDSYIISKKPKSILCIPMINQNKLLGIVYLENNLIIGAFTRDRLEVLKLLITQAAISLENAILYKNLAQAKEHLEEYNHTLEEKVVVRTAELNNKNQSLQQALQQLKLTQAKLIQSEKMSSLGQMVAGIAHEINNPINFIHANLLHTSEYIENLLDLINIYRQENCDYSPQIIEKSEEIDLDFIAEDLPRILNSMKVGSTRIRDIVLSLRNFSRLDESEMKSVNIHEGIDNALLILQHRIKKISNTNKQVIDKTKAEISIVKEYGKLPLVACYASQLNQVFMNIFTNAIDALEELTITDTELLIAPQIRINTALIESHIVRIRIFDNGCGMTEEIQQKIFDPFFTTKPIGSGTGLGLSISYQIVVEKHKGKLTCTSTIGQGTEFVIDIPLQQA
ncbi:ATP-binding sensor histidine kinase [Anabaena subtropica]|uniref:histidine kinase n=1 Tax=Anabaena subtropica FACHB-260 TaxID=2692884 RepID=A0ABR8CWS3_9NOST|nr:ATP-binding sensor histidine kinase [Anabaena subtropica]MBD2346895.1 AAA family ATPase [Anabaena subtropica FACHB-260]